MSQIASLPSAINTARSTRTRHRSWTGNEPVRASALERASVRPARSASIRSSAGVTPFLSWLRSHGTHNLNAHIDFFYTNAGPAPFADEIIAVAAGLPHLRLHLHDSDADGYLSADAVLVAIADDDPRGVSAFLCGPAPMVNAFVRRLRAAGMPSRNIHREHFDWR